MTKNKLISSTFVSSQAIIGTTIIQKERVPELVCRLIKLASISLVCSSLYICTSNAIVVPNPIDADKPIHVRSPVHLHKSKPVDKPIVVHKEVHLKTTTRARNDMYIKAGAGATFYDKLAFIRFRNAKKAPRTAPVYNIGLGYRINDVARADLNFQYTEVRYKTNDIRQTIRTNAAFVNGYYDINSHKTVMPYLTAGIGIGGNHAGNLRRGDIIYEGRDITNFVWNVGAGAMFKSNKNLAFDLGYKYMNLGYAKTKIAVPADKTARQHIRHHQILGSLIYSF